ncbi:MAG: hypothetical protein AB4041_10945 [Microcystaceae cyanobacterium]
MNGIIFIGIQASGKSSFCVKNFYQTHLRLNMDMLKTRHREKILFEACLLAKQPFVIDNTNPTKEDRKKYIEKLRKNQFRVIGYYFESKLIGKIIKKKAIIRKQMRQYMQLEKE